MMRSLIAEVLVISFVTACSGEPPTGGGTDSEGELDAEVDPTDGDEPSEPGDDPVDGLPNRDAFLTVRGIYNHVVANDITNIGDLLSDMPDSMRENYVLMEQTRSRHLADLESPRLIMFGLDARFLMAVGGVHEDPLREVVEMAELDEQTGQWIYRLIDFETGTPTLSANDHACQGCHGNPTRPIWGNYPDWPGAFGSDENHLTGGQRAMLSSLAEDPASSDRYHHLEFDDDYGSNVMWLPGRDYGYAYTSFNFELVVAVSDGLVTRMTQAPGWDTLKYTLLDASICQRGGQSEFEVLEQLGLDGPNDFQLHHAVFEAEGSGFDGFRWNQGSTYLHDVVVFQVLDEIVRTDEQMAAAVQSIEPTRTTWFHHWWELRGSQRDDWLRNDFDLYAYDLRPQELLPQAASEICDYLGDR
ncbi:MAG: hypothetical protein K0V04_36570 [Deltaproteobacteria bacterium]|nr:hypothetical protein [Deltaproteobacteria bacterium]